MVKLIYKIFKFSLLVLFLQSMFAWFLWGQSFFALLFSVGIAVLFYFSKRGNFSFKNTNVIPIILIIIIQLYVVRDANLNSLFPAMLRIIIISFVLLLNDKIKIYLFHFFTKAFAFLLSISLVAWILFLFGIALPNYQIEFGNGMYYFDNYYFFLTESSRFSLLIPRFSSVFLEPGQLGMITTFFLVANHFELKRPAIFIIFVATLLTFSLAAYLLLFISISTYFFLLSKNPIRNITVWCLLIFSVYFYFSNLNDGYNIVNTSIFNRLNFLTDGLESSNRTSTDFDLYFKKVIFSNDNLLGIGSVKYSQMSWQTGNAGYKVFLIQQGIIGTVLVFLFYLFVLLSNQSKMAWILFTIYIFCFIQAAYPLWECELLIFITAISFNKSINKNTNFKKYERT